MGGAPKHPVWYLNLMASPAVTLQDGANVYEMAAREAHGDEKTRWWALAVDAWPPYAEYQTRRTRRSRWSFWSPPGNLTRRSRCRPHRVERLTPSWAASVPVRPSGLVSKVEGHR